MKLQETPASVELIDVLVITLEMVFWGHCLIKLEESSAVKPTHYFKPNEYTL